MINIYTYLKKLLKFCYFKILSKNYNFNNYSKSWDRILKEVHKKYGSWDSRKGYNNFN